MLDKELQKQLERIARRPTNHLKLLYRDTDPRSPRFGKAIYGFDVARRKQQVELLTKKNEPVVSAPLLHRILEKSQRGRAEPASVLGILGMIDYGKKYPQKSSRKKRPKFNLFRRTYRAIRKALQKSISKDLWYRKRRHKYQ